MAEGRTRRWVRRLALAGAGASLAAAAVAPGAGAQDEPDDPGDDEVVLPDAFAGSASASALDVALLTPALIPVPNLFDLGLVRGSGLYERSNQAGTAAIVYPGNGIVIGPDLLCGTFIGPQLPAEALVFFGPILEACGNYEYPLSVVVDSLHPDAATEGALQLGDERDPISLGAVGARAHAGLDGTRTEAEVGDLRVLGLPALGALTPLLDLLDVDLPDATLVRADGLTARTDQRIVGDRLVLDAETTVTGLRLVGGLVRIGSITSRSHLAVGGAGATESATGTEIAGVEVAGVPAQITDDGLVLGDPGAPLGPLLQQLTSAVGAVLEGIGLSITALPSEEGEENGIPFARSGGLVVEFTTPLQGLPPIPLEPLGDLDFNGDYGVRVQIGTTGVRGFADTFEDPSGTSRPPTSSGGGGGGSSSRAGSGTGGGGTGSRPVATGGPTSAAPSVTEPTAEPAGFLEDAFADRLAFLYLSFTLAALALCLAPRLTLPARFPGGQRPSVP